MSVFRRTVARPGFSRTFLVLAGVLIVAMAWATRLPAQDLFYDAYDRGLRAYTAGNLAEARQMFERAMQLDSRQGRRKRFQGMVFKDYLPEYYLALISVKEKRYDKAIAYFTNLQRSGLIKSGDPEYATVVAERTVAEKGLAGASAPAEVSASNRGAPPPNDTAKSAPPITPPSSPPAAPPPAPAAAPPVVSPARPQPEAVAESRPANPEPRPSNEAKPPAVAATNPPRDTSPVPVPAKPAASAPGEFERLTNEFTRNLNAGAFEQAWDATSRIAALPGRLEASRVLAAQVREGVSRAGQRRLEENDVASAGRMLDLLARIAPTSVERQRLTRLVDDRRELSRLERGALKNLLLGEYQRVVEMTTPIVDSARASGRLMFYAACSRAALSLTADTDARARLTNDARRLFERASKQGASFDKEQRYISPEILRLLNQR